MLPTHETVCAPAMIGLLQRVTHARVEVDGQCIGRIEAGLLVLVGVQAEDDESRAARLLERLLGYRVFPDAEGRMNRSLRDTGGGLLLVPQFTLAADTRKGARAGFSTAAPPDRAAALFGHLAGLARSAHADVACGRFGADMQVSLTNDGPVTFWLEA
ncbi:MAG: D-tyrosyl-tRNA(Tyr) deacylase [Panacagrimonas sp.]|jgi:D-tyrosyl-tRNA(Tyr) deacylase|nr:D-tyrosyl-tRNA(Tyr) deacylase [Panacagrimonas sp.]